MRPSISPADCTRGDHARHSDAGEKRLGRAHPPQQSPETEGIPVIVISVVDEKKKGFVLGATDYLVKPVSSGDLTKALTRAGVATEDLRGLRVCLLDSGNGELDRIDGELRRAGCSVHRYPEFSVATLQGVSPISPSSTSTTIPNQSLRCIEALHAVGDMGHRWWPFWT